MPVPVFVSLIGGSVCFFESCVLGMWLSLQLGTCLYTDVSGRVVLLLRVFVAYLLVCTFVGVYSQLCPVTVTGGWGGVCIGDCSFVDRWSWLGTISY